MVGGAHLIQLKQDVSSGRSVKPFLSRFPYGGGRRPPEMKPCLERWTVIYIQKPSRSTLRVSVRASVYISSERPEGACISARIGVVRAG
jgi:hypothetical protein